MVLSAITRIRAQYKSDRKGKKTKRRFTISTRGVRVYDDESGVLEDDLPLNNISFIGVLPTNKKVFSFITSEQVGQELEHTCHVYKTSKKTKLITNTLGICFTLAVELDRALVQKEEEHASRQRSSSVFARDAQGRRKSSPSQRLPADFYGIVAALGARVDGSDANAADAEFVQRGLEQLVRLYEAARNSGGTGTQGWEGGAGGGGVAGARGGGGGHAAAVADPEKAALEKQHAAAPTLGGSGGEEAAPPYMVAGDDSHSVAGGGSGGAVLPPRFGDGSPSATRSTRIVVRPSSVAATPSNATIAALLASGAALPPPRRVAINRAAGDPLGLVVKSFKGMPGVWVEAVAAGASAARTQAVFVGDLITTIDGEPVVGWDYAQVATRLSMPQPTLELGLLSVRQLEHAYVGAGGGAGLGGAGLGGAGPVFNDE
jgi:hypothetical protein